MVRFAYRFVGDRARAEELAQDVFTALLEAAAAVTPGRDSMRSMTSSTSRTRAVSSA